MGSDHGTALLAIARVYTLTCAWVGSCGMVLRVAVTVWKRTENAHFSAVLRTDGSK